MPSLGQALDQAPELPAGLRVEAGRRLVQEQQLRAADDAERDVQPAALAAGQRWTRERRASRPGRPARSTSSGSQRVGVVAPRSAAPTRATVSSLDWPGRRPAAGRCRCGTATPRSPCAGSCPSTRDLAAVAAAVALEDLDRRGLAGAVRPEQREHLAARARRGRARRRRPAPGTSCAGRTPGSPRRSCHRSSRAPGSAPHPVDRSRPQPLDGPPSPTSRPNPTPRTRVVAGSGGRGGWRGRCSAW